MLWEHVDWVQFPAARPDNKHAPQLRGCVYSKILDFISIFANNIVLIVSQAIWLYHGTFTTKERERIPSVNNILLMNKEEIFNLKADNVSRQLTVDEVVYIATALGAFWTYDYKAAQQGKFGMHALLKSGLHSDGFFVSKILLEPENIKHIMSYQIALCLKKGNIPAPDYIVGVPDGATALGSRVAEILGVREALMEKVPGRAVLKTEIPSGATMLIVEDFCTRGTGFRETVLQVKSGQSSVKFLLYNPVIVNRGGLKGIYVEEVGTFTVLPVIERRIKDWDPKEYCPLCAFGSIAVKPKLSDENWQLLVTSQL